VQEKPPPCLSGVAGKTSSVNMDAPVTELTHLGRSLPGVNLMFTSTTRQYYVLANIIAIGANHIQHRWSLGVTFQVKN